MIELATYRYRFGNSVLHQLDVRFKLIFLVMISCVSLKAHGAALSVLTILLLALMTSAGLTAKSLLTLLRYILIFLVLIFIARALSIPGAPIFKYKTVTVTREGIYGGALVCWRLVIVILIGLAFVATTRTSEVKAAVEWFLYPVPFIPAKRVSIMMSLVIRFIPVILDQAKETTDAQRARGVENRKNPVYRLQKLLITLMRRTFERADKLVMAMEARCYTENRTDPGFSATLGDWIALVVVSCLCIVIIVL
jgi:energy-coupling factor transporter transmembrane protein EcfT